MHEQLAEVFPHVSQQLVSTGSQLESEHRRCFHLACAIIVALNKRHPNWLDLLDGIIVDIRVPDQEPFHVVATRETDYAFLDALRDDVWWTSEKFRATDFAQSDDLAVCVNAFLNAGLDVLRTRRAVAATTAA